MKNKKLVLLLSILMIGTTTSNAAYITNNNNPKTIENHGIMEIEQEELKFTRINEVGDTIEVYEKEIKDDSEGKVKYILKNKETERFVNVYKGTIDSKEEMRNDDKKIEYILKDKETERFVNVYKGVIDSKEEIKNDRIEVMTPRTTSKPTRIEWEEYASDWSGIINFIHTKYAFPSGYFVAWAEQPFSVIVYDYDYDTSYGRVHAVYTNGRYEVETGGGNFSYYCTLSNANKSVPMTNAIYKSIPAWWHN